MTWTRTSHDIWEGHAGVRRYAYHYFAKADEFPYMVHCGNVLDGNHRYLTEWETRSACERHFATGEWETPEQEAEAVARVRWAGVPLTWTLTQRFNLHNGEIAEAGPRCYMIHTKKRRAERGGDLHFVHEYRVGCRYQRWEYLPRPRKYLSRADAKAACERHYATNQWE